jgi:hypothetical protein
MNNHHQREEPLPSLTTLFPEQVFQATSPTTTHSLPQQQQQESSAPPSYYQCLASNSSPTMQQPQQQQQQIPYYTPPYYTHVQQSYYHQPHRYDEVYYYSNRQGSYEQHQVEQPNQTYIPHIQQQQQQQQQQLMQQQQLQHQITQYVPPSPIIQQPATTTSTPITVTTSGSKSSSKIRKTQKMRSTLQSSSSNSSVDTVPANTDKTEATHSKVVTKKYRDKKAPTAYNLYYKEHFQQVKKDNPDTPMSELSSMVAEQWRMLSKNEQLAYYEKYRQNKGTQEKKKRPLNAYHLFCKEKFEQIKREMPDGDVASWSRVAGSMWKSLEREGQRVYYERATQQFM